VFNCANGLLQRCSSGRDGFEAVRRCETPELCDASRGAQGCRAPVCEIGERRCDGTSVVQCREGRDGFEAIAECGGPGCNAATASCQPAACAAGERRCRGARLEACNAARTGFTLLESCASASLCVEIQGGRSFDCAAPACSAGQAECRNRSLAVCNADLTDFDVVNCGLLGCNDDEDPPTCRTLGDLLD
jgi:hypothetical protein